jgi:ankyrin repeat protein
LAGSRDPHGATALFLLPDDEDRALQAVELLLAFGADQHATNDAGATAAQAARKRGLDDAADMIEAAGG